MFINENGVLLERGGKIGGISFGANASDESYAERGFYPLGSEIGISFGGLVILKKTARERFKKERDAIYTSPINNIQVSTTEDLINLQGYLLRETEEPIEWLMADNTTANLYLSDIAAVLDAYAVRKRLAFEDFNAACRELELASTESEINAIHVEIVE